ncbi:hypothetical protein P879_04663 [Paragonimus westermani]|uniref:Dynein assembly factor 3, axonemal n=1 Tax=Paragonimus westermani TaxID=34504 RepID=A0A8T0DGQ0_9TREM|nr:hypothetical protein P879_04663 [Paragonimus westermani]
MSATSKAEGLGSVAWWGFSPAIDLIETYSGFFDSLSIDSVTVLIAGGSDSRHILQTVSNAVGDSNLVQTYFILDSALEVYARYMLQIYIAMEQEDRFNLQEKTELFLELFGNTMIREFTATYLRHVATEFIKYRIELIYVYTDYRITTSFEDSTKCLQFMNMMHLRFRERDVLESIFKFWREKDENIFNIFKCWDYRLRRHLGTRYDAIPNVFDWDCSITLHDRQADQIDSREYSWWRRRGVAFELRPADYTVSNRCLASGKPFRNSKGENTVYWGYWGDITCSPYLAFGITTSMYPELAKKVNGRRSYGATTISEVNVRSLLWRLGHGCKCPLKVAAPFCIDNSRDTSEPEQDVNAPSDLSHDAPVSGPSLAVQDSGESTVTSPSTEESTTSISVKFHLLANSYYSFVALLYYIHNGSAKKPTDASLDARLEEKPYAPLKTKNQFGVKYLPLNSFTELSSRYRSLFVGDGRKPIDIVYMGCSMSHLLDDEKLVARRNYSKETSTKDETETMWTDDNTGLVSILNNRALLIVESVLYMVELRPAEVEAYVERITKSALRLGFRLTKKPEPMKDHHLYFVHDRANVESK